MQLKLEATGHIPADYPAVWFRVECWQRGRCVADFTTQGEADAFAISHAKAHGYRYDHKVATMRKAT